MKSILLSAVALLAAAFSFAQNVGIGTTTPSSPLHIRSAISNNPFIIDGTASSYYSILENGIARGYWGSYAGNPEDVDFGTYTGATGKLHLTIQAVPKLTITNTGNVGIGITAPLGRLDIIGAGTTLATNTFLLRNSTGDTMLRMRDDGRMGIGYNGATYGRTVNLGGTGMNFYTPNEAAFGGAIFPTDTSLIIWSNSNANNYVSIQPSWGNLGIGTYTPNSKLHLNGAMLIGGNSINPATGYSLSVDGKIICEEARVQISGSWPDYVFNDDYKLRPLDELEKLIRSQKHLPNIPPAAEVEKEGFDLGGMNKKLLEKVEELTLYIIELSKDNKLLNERIKKLEEK